MKKKIRINFSDWWDGFNKEVNRYYNMLKQYYEIEISEDPEFLFYSCFGRNFKKYNCVRIFGNGENVMPNFNDCDYGEGCDYLDYGDRYIRHINYFINKSICNRDVVNNEFFNRRFCNFIYSNATSGEGAVLRQEFCQKLMEYKHIDCPGKILHNMDAEDELAPREGDWWASKLEFLKKYKFTIAFENSRSDGYTTEKLLQPLQSFSVPIYWGNALVTRDFNPKAFINCNDYDNDFDAVIERIKELDNDPDKYLAMLRENPMQPDYDFEHRKKYEQWLINIIEKGNKPFNKDPRKWGDRSLGNIPDNLFDENECLLNENKALKQKIETLDLKVKKFASQQASLEQKYVPMVKPFKKVKGNWFYKRVETERYIKTYICGICTRKRSANLCQYIDSGLHELENRLKKYMNSQIQAIDGKMNTIQLTDFNPLQDREFIEWSNTWVEDARDFKKKRILIIGDSVARAFRGSLNDKLPQYSIDFIGFSFSLEDSSLYNICQAYFADRHYCYDMILLNVGAQHGFYIAADKKTTDADKFKVAYDNFLNYVKDYCQNIAVLTATPNVLDSDVSKYDEVKNKEIVKRNQLSEEIAKKYGYPVVDLYDFVIKQKYSYADRQHFSEKKTQEEIADYIIKELHLKEK